MVKSTNQDTSSSQPTRRSSRRSRKTINYNENHIAKRNVPSDSDDEPLINKKRKKEENSDSDFEPDKFINNSRNNRSAKKLNSNKRNVKEHSSSNICQVTNDQASDEEFESNNCQVTNDQTSDKEFESNICQVTNNETSDGEFEASDDEAQTIPRKKKVNKKSIKGKKDKIKKQSLEINDIQDPVFKPIVGFIHQPNLSEDESSDSDAEDSDSPQQTENAQQDIVIQSNNNIKDNIKETNDISIFSVVSESNKKAESDTGKSNCSVKENQEKVEQRNKLSRTKRKRIISNITDEKDRKHNKELDVENIKKTKDTVKKRSRQSKRKDKIKVERQKDSSSSSDNDNDEAWEDVDEVKVKSSPKKKKIKVEEDKVKVKDVEINVGVQSIHKKKKSRAEKIFIWIRQSMGRVLRERQILYHKCHLLCLLFKTLHENNLCNDKDIQGYCLSLIPPEYFDHPQKNWNINHLRRFLSWFKKNYLSLNKHLSDDNNVAIEQLQKLSQIHILCIMFRVFGFLTRMIYSLHPISAKIKKEKDVTSPPSNEKGKETSKAQKSTLKSSTSGTSKDESVSSKKSPYFKSKDDNLTTDKTPKNKQRKSNVKSSKKRTQDIQTDEIDHDNPEIEKKFQFGCEMWLEIYMDTLKTWVCFELSSENFNQPYELEKVARKPLQYVIGIDNNNKIKDVTCRYASKWLSYNRKLRIDREWWGETLRPYEPPNDVIHRAEDAKLKKLLMEQDFPTSVSEFKDNPLYALQRHLLKFQAIYPESAVPLGYIRSEPIFSRDCVRELHTRETWMKQALVVKKGEIPYKIVKGRPKRNTPVSERDKITVNLFGEWQTEKYIPPPVVDGKVPKNEYGNVELFKSCMLPAGAVHLPLNNIQRIARKLGIDHAPAMMGWDFHGGFSHPVIEGIVVAKEFEDVLLDAWQKDDEEQQKKEKQKREKAIYDNWKTLIKGLLIRHKLQKKYNFQEEASTSNSIPSKTNTKANKLKVKKKLLKKPEKANDEYSNLSVSWPSNKMEGTMSLSADGHVHVFLEANNKIIDSTLMKFCTCGLTLPVDNEEQL